MTDKLQDVVEKFFLDFGHYQDQDRELSLAIDPDGVEEPREPEWISVRDASAFLAQYVLCEKEPVGYFDKYDFEEARTAGVKMETMVVAQAPFGYLCCPLHIPANPK